MKVQENFEDVIAKHQKKIYRIVFSFVKNEADTDEIVQQTFFNAFKSYKNFEGRSSVETWLIRIAINNVRTHFRKRKFFSIFQVFSDAEEEIKELILNPRTLILLIFISSPIFNHVLHNNTQLFACSVRSHFCPHH